MRVAPAGDAAHHAGEDAGRPGAGQGDLAQQVVQVQLGLGDGKDGGELPPFTVASATAADGREDRHFGPGGQRVGVEGELFVDRDQHGTAHPGQAGELLGQALLELAHRGAFRQLQHGTAGAGALLEGGKEQYGNAIH